VFVNGKTCERVRHPANYKFTGYERDPETNNDYAFARYYSPRLERFLSPDPVSGDITDPQTLNKYTYVRNNPTNLTDPSGLLTCVDCGGGGGGGGGGGWRGCILCVGGNGGYDGGGGGLPTDSSTSAQNGSNPNPPSEDPSGDPWTFGCESLGMPCGMNFPVGAGGPDPSGCTYGSGSCGGMIYGYTEGQSSGWFQNYLQTFLGLMPWETFPVQSWILSRRPKKQYGPLPLNAPKPPLNPADPPGPGWVWDNSDGGKWVNPGTGEELHPDLNHKPPIPPLWDWTDPFGGHWRIFPMVL